MQEPTRTLGGSSISAAASIPAPAPAALPAVSVAQEAFASPSTAGVAESAEEGWATFD